MSKITFDNSMEKFKFVYTFYNARNSDLFLLKVLKTYDNFIYIC